MAKSPVRSVDWGNAVEAVGGPKYRMIIRVWGQEKSGKTRLGMTGPGPVAIHCFDLLGLEGTLDQARKDDPTKEFRIFKYHFNKNADNVQDDAIAVRDQFLEDVKISMQHARTVIVDETELFECWRWSQFGDKSDNPSNYDKLYADYRSWIHAFDETDCNLVLIQKVKEKWESVEKPDRNGVMKEKGKPSGKYVATGYKDLKFVVKVNIESRWTPEGGFALYLENCGYNMGVAGQELPGITMSELGQLVFEESSTEDWE